MGKKLFSDGIDLNGDDRFERDILILMSFHESSHKNQELEIEYLGAYIHAVRDLFSSYYSRSHPNGIPAMVLRSDQTCIPFLFLCKHSLELAMKHKLKDVGAGYPDTHELKKLWGLLSPHIETGNPLFEELIEGLDFLDRNYALRYFEDKKGNENNNGVITIHAPSILETTEELFNVLVSEHCF